VLVVVVQALAFGLGDERREVELLNMRAKTRKKTRIKSTFRLCYTWPNQSVLE
jgi:hypothetical protein